MAEVFETLAGLDRLIHDPPRLAILTALSVVQSADFTFLLRLTGLSAGNLSGHLVKLEEGGLVQIEKGYVNRRPNTSVSITSKGKQAIEGHWKQLEDLRKETQSWRPGEEQK